MKVTRYDLTEEVSTGRVDITPVPESLEGRYVTFEDYSLLNERFNELESAMKALEESCGFVEDGSHCTTKIFQDDATKTWHIQSDCVSAWGDSLLRAIQIASIGLKED